MNNKKKSIVSNSIVDQIHNWICLLLIIGMFVYTGISIPQMPETIPTHFNARGTVDGWGSKWMLLMLPGVCLGLYILLTFVGNHPEWHNRPGKMTLRQSKTLLSWVKFELVLMFAYMTWRGIQVSLGHLNGMGAWLLPTIILVFGLTAVVAFQSVRMKRK